MSESMYGWCSTGKFHLHERTAIGYEKVAEGPTYESTPSGNIKVIGQAHFRYFTVWVCQSCAKTWWIEDHPRIEASAQPVAIS